MHKVWFNNKLIISSIITGCLLITPVAALAASISHSYSPEGSISNGELVSLDPNYKNSVQLANSSNGTHLLGVAIAKNGSLLSINDSSNTIQIALSGTVPTLVSTLNGPIKTGDLISVSPINGIGMKAEQGLSIIGQAEASFNADSAGASTQAITDNAGKVTDVRVGYIDLSLNVSKGTLSGNIIQLNILQKIVKDLTGHVVSTFRIVVSLVVASIALAVLASVMYGSIYGSIISIGRNPLAKFSVLRSLRFVLALAILIAAISIIVIFFLLY